MTEEFTNSIFIQKKQKKLNYKIKELLRANDLWTADNYNSLKRKLWNALEAYRIEIEKTMTKLNESIIWNDNESFKYKLMMIFEERLIKELKTAPTIPI